MSLARTVANSPALFVVPAFLLYCLFTIVPLFSVFFYSFVEWRGPFMDRFAAFENYVALFSSPSLQRQVLNAFANNWYFFVGTMVIQNSLGLGLALLLHRQLAGKRFFQAVIASPFLVNPLVVGYAWLLLLNPTFGPVAQGLGAVGLEGWIRPWLGDPALARPAVILINAWQWVGFPMLIFMAARGGISDELYQAARLDRVSSRQAFFHITLPLMAPSISTVALLTFIGCFNAFGLQYAIGGINGSPAGVNDVLGLVFYRFAFGDSLNAVGSSSALATLMFLFIFVVALGLRTILSRIERSVE
jgi:raffinose/stachyose/melibiose transport system permease protein